MRIFGRLHAVLLVVAKRLASQPGLMLAEVLGLVVALALMMSIPIYADAVYYRIFLEDLAAAETEKARSPFTFVFNYNGSTYGSKEWEEIVPVDTYLSEQAANTLGLETGRVRHDAESPSDVPFVVRYFSTEPFGMVARDPTTFEASPDDHSDPLVWSSFAFISYLEPHITLVEGRFPTTLASGWLEREEPVEVLVSEALAVELGVQIDEIYVVLMPDRLATGSDLQVPIKITGIWRPTEPQSDFWFFEPDAFRERLLVTEATFVDHLSVAVTEEIYTAAWALLMAPTGFNDRVEGARIALEANASLLLDRALEVQRRVVSLLPDIKLVHSPLEVLGSYRRAVNLLMILLYAFSLPIFALLLSFVGLTSGLFVEQRRNEIAVLRSRGAGMSQLMGTVVLESLLLGSVALLLGFPLGTWIARFIGRARSFLDFALRVDGATPALTVAALRLGWLGLGLTVVAQVFPSLGAMRHTITSYKQERARLLRKPWWQRAWLDLLLLLPVVYGAYLLWMQGSIVSWGEAGSLSAGASDMFQDPLLFLVPALGIFALTLFFLRWMPWLMKVVIWFVSHTRSVGLLMAARHLARSPRFYTTPLVLLVLTLSLSAFTASLAHTLDRHLHDQMYYQTGANMVFMDLGESQMLTTDAQRLVEAETPVEAGQDNERDRGPRWLFLPVSEYLALPGVQSATRVGRYPATTRVGEETYTGVFMGVERYDFSRVAFWRKDFAPESLGALMNALAATPNGVLVPHEFIQARFLQVGDRLRVLVNTYGQTNELDFNIVGTFDLFPTWYPETEGPLFVGDLDYLFREAGGQFPYQVWLGTAPDVDYTEIEKVQRENWDFQGLDWKAPALRIVERQRMPERQGLFGVLSVGFIAAALLTVLGFLLYALFSFRRRFIEFGVLRAVGLSTWQMTAFLGWELAFLILIGGGLGTALGVGVSSFFIPYLQVGADEMARIPPYNVDIAWSAVFRVYGLFGLLFVVALIALVIMLQRMRIFQAIKLGESA